MSLPFRACINPVNQRLFFIVTERSTGIRRRHLQIGIIRQNSADNLTLRSATGNNCRMAFALLLCRFLHVETQISLTFCSIRTVTVKALVGQNRSDVAIEGSRAIKSEDWNTAKEEHGGN